MSLQRVLHVSSMPPGATYADILTPFCLLGNVVHAMILPVRTQALVEMETVEAARRIVEHAGKHGVSLLGRTVHVSFSRSAEIDRTVGVRVRDGKPEPPAPSSTYRALPPPGQMAQQQQTYGSSQPSQSPQFGGFGGSSGHASAPSGARYGSGNTSGDGYSGSGGGGGGGGGGGHSHGHGHGAGRVLHIVIQNALYAVTVDTLAQV
jgi:hypothetical protein